MHSSILTSSTKSNAGMQLKGIAREANCRRQASLPPYAGSRGRYDCLVARDDNILARTGFHGASIYIGQE
ncbi:hypothetical protein TIFTF001_020644 [Ficus carica]|uniref:Uncharacterized protein n=1 Tax=Ficus carica TaxID=3494 RepID=A0AA88A8Z0_FICCA|nr:hypothetical protein TIFTF001_020644 [Ficus carica]